MGERKEARLLFGDITMLSSAILPVAWNGLEITSVGKYTETLRVLSAPLSVGLQL